MKKQKGILHDVKKYCSLQRNDPFIIMGISVYSVASRNIVINFLSNLTTVTNIRYNTTLFILQQDYIQIHMLTKVLVSILQ